MFYTYYQNNSFGQMMLSEPEGLTHYVIIEADSAEEADARAEASDINMYFDGVEKGLDCPCCGDRWSRQYGDGTEEPRIYGKPATDYSTSWSAYMPKGKEICIHYADGRVEWYGVRRELPSAPQP
jgi:hypothetical protein